MEDERATFEDPITLDLMEDAVMAPCGHSFSKDSIEQWLAPQGQDFCPLCKQRFASKELRPNYALRDAIERFKQTHGLPATDRLGLDITKPIATWSVDETQKWIENFPDWVEDSILIQEHRIDGQTLAQMSEEELMDKLQVPAEHIPSLMDKIEKVKRISKNWDQAALVHPLSMDKGGSPSKEETDSEPTSTPLHGANIEQQQGPVEAAPRGPGEDDPEPSCWGSCSDCRSCDAAKETETGCCIFECNDCCLCQCAHGWYECCSFSIYRSPGALFCEFCGGQGATYTRRTFWGICFIPFLMILLFLLFLEAVFWVTVAVLVVLLCVCALAVVVGGNATN